MVKYAQSNTKHFSKIVAPSTFYKEMCHDRIFVTMTYLNYVKNCNQANMCQAEIVLRWKRHHTMCLRTEHECTYVLKYDHFYITQTVRRLKPKTPSWALKPLFRSVTFTSALLFFLLFFFNLWVSQRNFSLMSWWFSMIITDC